MLIYTEIDPSTRVDQGDVFLDTYFPAIDANVNAVVTTPTCDIEQDKATFIKFVSTIPLYAAIQAIAHTVNIEESVLWSGESLSKTKSTNLVEAVRSNTTGNLHPRYYLLPEFPDIFPASYLDLQRVFVVPYPQVVEEYMGKRVARIVSPWREDVLARYAGYSMRVGIPDYTVDDIRGILELAGIKLKYE